MEWPFKCALCFFNLLFLFGEAGDQRIDVQRNVDSKFLPEASKMMQKSSSLPFVNE
jgi:hypothetical protein